MNSQQDVSDRTLARVIGQEIRRAREARGWTRAELIEQIPSEIGERTLLSYEYGARSLTVLRFVEICRALGTAAADLLAQALEKARDLRTFPIRVDLRKMLDDQRSEYATVRTWARNRLADDPNPEVHLAPATVREMATILDLTHSALADYLYEFAADRPAMD